MDFLTPGGVGSDGWQYAVDFPSSYHPRKSMTDYVRRRRWARDCKLVTSGPWAELGNTKVKSISLQVIFLFYITSFAYAIFFIILQPIYPCGKGMNLNVFENYVKSSAPVNK